MPHLAEPAPRGRRGPARQGEHERVGQHPLNRSSSGWSARGGQCRNPYVLDRNPCGSSSGSAAAVSANLGAVAVGTETDGSIVCPASANGVVGLKPTVGLVSRAGIIPISHTQDTAGPLCRTVADAAALLGAMAGADPRDPATAPASGHRGAGLCASSSIPPAFGGADRRGAREVLRVQRRRPTGWPKQPSACSGSEGAIVVDPADIPNAGDLRRGRDRACCCIELKADLNAYLADPRTRRAGTHAGRTSSRSTSGIEGARDAVVRPGALPAGGGQGPAHDTGLPEGAARSATAWPGAQGIDAVMDKHRLDALVAPTGNPAWPTDPVNGDHFTGSELHARRGGAGIPASASRWG